MSGGAGGTKRGPGGGGASRAAGVGRPPPGAGTGSGAGGGRDGADTPDYGASVLYKAGRIAAYVAWFVLGCAAGWLGAFAQGAYRPGGLIVALAGAGGLFVAGGLLMKARPGAAVPAAGWLITVFYIAAAPRAEGDWVFTGGITSYLFLLGGSIVGAMIAMQPWGGSAHPLLLSGERLPGNGN